MNGFGPTNGELMLRAAILRYWLGVAVKIVFGLVALAVAVKYLAS